MKSLIKAVAVALVIAAPVASFAQSNQPVTRAQVRAELQQLEAVGYNPAAANDEDYPANLQAAEARVAANQGQAVQTSGYGGSVSGSSQSGNTMHAPAAVPNSERSVFFGH